MTERGAARQIGRFAAQTILIAGASGGLGAAIAQAFAAEGASLALAGHSRLPDVALPGAASVSRHQADLTDPASLAALRDAARAAHGRVDVVVNATGCDVRKPLAAHTPDDLRRTLDVNLLGAMLLTHAFLPALGDGMIVYLGGFADGRLAFPFYSADVASCAGVRAFSEAANRELALAGRRASVLFFSPSPADTDAERLFHPLWRELGTTIVAPEKVAAAVVTAVARRERVHIMGGWTTRLFAALNAIAPRLADALLMRRYGAAQRRFFVPSGGLPPGGQPPDSSPRPPPARGRTLGIALLVASFFACSVLLSLPFLPWRWRRCWWEPARRHSGSAGPCWAKKSSRAAGSISPRAPGGAAFPGMQTPAIPAEIDPPCRQPRHPPPGLADHRRIRRHRPGVRVAPG